MMDTLGVTQKHLLRQLRAEREGLSMDMLATRLEISRTAVRQHLTALEKLGFVEKGAIAPTGGRPGQRYRLAGKGQGLFTKQYALFSGLVLQAMLKEKGETGLKQWLAALGKEAALSLAPRVVGKPLKVRIEETAAILSEFAYEAEVVTKGSGGTLPVIEASNCVYHDVARDYRQVCAFDIAMLENLIGTTVEHTACIHDGERVCRFGFKPR